MRRWELEGATCVLMAAGPAWAPRLLAAFAITDPLKPEAPAVVAALRWASFLVAIRADPHAVATPLGGSAATSFPRPCCVPEPVPHRHTRPPMPTFLLMGPTASLPVQGAQDQLPHGDGGRLDHGPRHCCPAGHHRCACRGAPWWLPPRRSTVCAKVGRPAQHLVCATPAHAKIQRLARRLQVLPAGKAERIRALQEGGRRSVAMVGDGINDSGRSTN